MSDAHPLEARVEQLEERVKDLERGQRYLNGALRAREPHAISSIRMRFGVEVTVRDLAAIGDMITKHGAPFVRAGNNDCDLYLCHVKGHNMLIVWCPTNKAVVTAWNASAGVVEEHGARAKLAHMRARGEEAKSMKKGP